MYKLYQGDCLERMKEIESGSVDLTVTSPPYDNLRSYNGNAKEWCEDVWREVLRELYRVTKQGGVVVWVVGDATHKGSETGTSFKQALFAKECGFNLHDTMLFMSDKPPLTHNRYEQCFEYMFVFSKGKPKTTNLMREPCKHAGASRKGTTQRQDSDEKGSRAAKGVVKNEKIRNNAWKYQTSGKIKSAIEIDHPAVFPVQLALDHITTWSNPGDMVLDTFTGSGTTGVACASTNRKFIGIELDPGYFKMAQERIAKAYAESLGAADLI